MKKKYSNMISKGVALLSFFLIVGGVNAQNNQWNLVQSTPKVDIYEQTDVVCNISAANVDMMYTFLKMKNKTASDVQVTFLMAIYYDNQCRTCANSEYEFTINIPAGQTIAGDCAFDTAEKGMLGIFQKYINQPNYGDYTRYELQNLVIQ
jgi:hypothetical protein